MVLQLELWFITKRANLEQLNRRGLTKLKLSSKNWPLRLLNKQV